MKTAESVTPKHPDKLADRIADAILDACLEQDPVSRCAIEVMGGHGEIKITGEVTTKADVDIESIAKSIIGEGFLIQQNIKSQSLEIASGVDMGGAGDQGIMVGYACDENEAMIPQELYLARSLCKFIYAQYPHDGKTQVTLDEHGNIKTIVASFQNVPNKDLEFTVRDWMDLGDGVENILCNPAGDWNLGGFDADTGVTGRKLIVDNYGPQIPIGGGSFSGKDATKVDRSGAYMARKVAVDLLQVNPDAKDCTVKIAYAIGVAEPVMAIATLTYEELEPEDINLITRDLYDLTPKGIIEFLKLREPKFKQTAEWGHFGNNFLWDK